MKKTGDSKWLKTKMCNETHSIKKIVYEDELGRKDGQLLTFTRRGAQIIRRNRTDYKIILRWSLPDLMR